MLSNLIDKLKSVIISDDTTNDITGYVLMSDSDKNKSLVLVKENDKYWKTQWIENNKIVNSLPSNKLETVFSPIST